MYLPRIVIGGTGSGCGKTTVACAVLKALKNRGLYVTAAKCGPDYIDPMFHEKALGIPSKNIDLFFTENDVAAALLAEHAKGSDICVIEGVMGYYDGLSFDSDLASAYDTAKAVSSPAVIVINAGGIALTAAALAKGMADFRNDSGIRGFILNNISPSSYGPLKKLIEKNTGLPVMGFLPKNSDFSIKSRHLGLVTPDEKTSLAIEKMAEAAEKYIDLDMLIKTASEAEELSFNEIDAEPGKAFKLAAALDEAFCFYYADNLRLLKKLGAEIVFFSPLKDEKLPPDTDGILLGGGYPELFAENLSKNKNTMESIKNAIDDGMPCLAECGGYMYLSMEIDGFEMAGIFSGRARDTGKLSRFGYLELRSDREYIDGIKGHEFHHWDMDDTGNKCTAVKPSGKIWKCMDFYKNVIAGYPHLYYWSKPEFAMAFAEKCRTWRK